ncbi:MAG: MFS transporter [Deltaproteobacteria bacterium]|nr:MFS transporter [Deltaproteobacteria bacterium]
MKNMNYRWIILLLFVVSQLILSIGGFGWGPLAPFLKKTMFLNGTQIGLISSSFYLTASLSALPAGIAIDRYGVKTGVLSWIGITGFFLFVLSFIHNYALFLIFVALSGIGYGMGNPVASKGLFMWFDLRTRGTAFGIRQAAVTVGGAVAGILLVFISERMGPYIAIRTVGAMIMIMFILCLFFYHDPLSRKDMPGREKGRKKEKNKFRSLFNNKPLLILSFIFALLGLSQGIVSTFLLLYANEKLGYSLIASGSFLTIAMISGAAGRILWGIISDRIFQGARRPVIHIIVALATLCSVTLALWGTDWPGWLFMPFVVIVGMTCIGFNSIAILTAAELSEKNKTATSVGFVSTIAWAGLFIGPLFFGAITDHFGYFYSWMTLALFSFICFFLCFFLSVPASES